MTAVSRPGLVGLPDRPLAGLGSGTQCGRMVPGVDEGSDGGAARSAVEQLRYSNLACGHV